MITKGDSFSDCKLHNQERSMCGLWLWITLVVGFVDCFSCYNFRCGSNWGEIIAGISDCRLHDWEGSVCGSFWMWCCCCCCCWCCCCGGPSSPRHEPSALWETGCGYSLYRLQGSTHKQQQQTDCHFSQTDLTVEAPRVVILKLSKEWATERCNKDSYIIQKACRGNA